MATIKFWSEMTKATTVDGEDKVMIGRNATGEAMYADFQYLINQAGMNSSDYIPVDGNTLPDGGEGNKVTFAGPGTYTQSGGDDVVVPENSIGILFYDGSKWSLGSLVTFDLPDSSEVLEWDEDEGLEYPSVRSYGGTIWRVVEGETTSSNDIPSEDSDVWEKIRGNFEDIIIGAYNHFTKAGVEQGYQITGTGKVRRHLTDYESFIMPVSEGESFSVSRQNVHNNPVFSLAFVNELPTDDTEVDALSFYTNPEGLEITDKTAPSGANFLVLYLQNSQEEADYDSAKIQVEKSNIISSYRKNVYESIDEVVYEALPVKNLFDTAHIMTGYAIHISYAWVRYTGSAHISLIMPVTEKTPYSISRGSLNYNDKFEAVFLDNIPETGEWERPLSPVFRANENLKIEGMYAPEGAKYLMVYLNSSSGSPDIERAEIQTEKGLKSHEYTNPSGDSKNVFNYLSTQEIIEGYQIMEAPSSGAVRFSNNRHKCFIMEAAEGEVFSLSRASVDFNDKLQIAFIDKIPEKGVDGGQGEWEDVLSVYRNNDGLKIEGVTAPEGTQYVFLYLQSTQQDFDFKKAKLQLEKSEKAHNFVPNPQDSDSVDDRERLPKFAVEAIKEARKEVNINQNKNSYLTFGFLTDTHVGRNHNPDFSHEYAPLFSEKVMVKLANEKWLDFVLHGGDAVEAYETSKELAMDNIGKFKEVLGEVQIPYFFVMGNHDLNQKEPNQNITPLELYNLHNRPIRHHVSRDILHPFENYFYKDFEDYGVRFIVLKGLDEGETFRIESHQRDWFENIAMDTDKTLILAVHWYDAAGVKNYLKPILNAFQSEGGEIACVISGHTHVDSHSSVDGYNVTHTATTLINTPEAVTKNDILIDIFTIDTDEKKVKIHRVGRGSNRQFDY